MNKARHILHHLYGIVQRFAWYYRRIFEYSIVIRIYCDRPGGEAPIHKRRFASPVEARNRAIYRKKRKRISEFIRLDGEFSVSLITPSIDRNNLLWQNLLFLHIFFTSISYIENYSIFACNPPVFSRTRAGNGKARAAAAKKYAAMNRTPT